MYLNGKNPEERYCKMAPMFPSEKVPKKKGHRSIQCSQAKNAPEKKGKIAMPSILVNETSRYKIRPQSHKSLLT
ncbi:hypothetical protein CD30_06730 [Ureibacillus massiliensis 4400831 = CIP 108448 = CCUG 49529]|uniref:Uncharacterized protein n=1 Tax=Ureibacillus massiliensis 4400831 = CIP 108448 = CCUG 49529 TaxID=1211035 RepID=A0A0A3J2U2_9BACL|nr:hypothetical protein CD30_06730 [Ureibacillus massiliensis 4400831 = CIP 108448 = CCUG 49529]